MMEWAYFDGTCGRRPGARGRASVIGATGMFAVGAFGRQGQFGVGRIYGSLDPRPRLRGGRLCAGVTGELERAGDFPAGAISTFAGTMRWAGTKLP